MGAKMAGDVAKGAADTAKSAVQGATEDSSGPNGS
jgi:type IV secretion system protein TrbL